MILAQGARGCG
ncbi:MAG: hypothetical protein EZS28_049349, partial [Streblomastix strix]